jgi:hypothetical protein
VKGFAIVALGATALTLFAGTASADIDIEDVRTIRESFNSRGDDIRARLSAGQTSEVNNLGEATATSGEAENNTRVAPQTNNLTQASLAAGGNTSANGGAAVGGYSGNHNDTAQLNDQQAGNGGTATGGAGAAGTTGSQSGTAGAGANGAAGGASGATTGTGGDAGGGGCDYDAEAGANVDADDESDADGGNAEASNEGNSCDSEGDGGNGDADGGNGGEGGDGGNGGSVVNLAGAEGGDGGTGVSRGGSNLGVNSNETVQVAATEGDTEGGDGGNTTVDDSGNAESGDNDADQSNTVLTGAESGDSTAVGNIAVNDVEQRIRARIRID